MQNISIFKTEKYTFNLENFQGPIDLLLNLIEKNKMNIYDIKLDELTDQYIYYINKAQDLNLDITSEFLVMASTLVYLKSKKLLPEKEEKEEEISEEELVKKIIEYKKYKDITKKLKENFDINSKKFFKLPEKIELPKQIFEEQYDPKLIPELYKNKLNKNKEKINENSKNIEKIAIKDTYTVASKVKQMFKILIQKRKFIFNKIFSIKEHNKQEIVTAFSGLLELSRREKVITEQDGLFNDISVKKRGKKLDKN